MDLFFRQRWNDHRLKHNMSRSLVLMTGTKHVADLIWVPDTIFINSIDAKMHDVTIQNNKLDIFPNGDVFWGTRFVFSQVLMTASLVFQCLLGTVLRPNEYILTSHGVNLEF